jgi:hypothetical protein
VLDDVDILVAGTNDLGLGSLTSSVSDSSLHLSNSRIRVLSTGQGISSLGFTSSADSSLLVTNTVIELLGAGTAVTNTDSGVHVYRSILVRSEVDNARAFVGAGSGFRPIIENSRIELTGFGTIAFSTNNGSPRIRNSFVQAATGFIKTGSSVFQPVFRIDNSIIDTSVTARIDVVNGESNLRIGASQLDTSIVSSEPNGTNNFTCVGVYTGQYVALDSSCQ